MKSNIQVECFYAVFIYQRLDNLPGSEGVNSALRMQKSVSHFVTFKYHRKLNICNFLDLPPESTVITGLPAWEIMFPPDARDDTTETGLLPKNDFKGK